jgi:hypothetical protein
LSYPYHNSKNETNTKGRYPEHPPLTPDHQQQKKMSIMPANKSIVTSMEYYHELTHKVAGRKRPRKEVSFTAEVATTTDASPPIITEDEAARRWYQRIELALFKLDAKDFMLGIANENNSETMRGLERYNVERVRGKTLIVKSTLRAIEKGITDEKLAILSQRCSAWSRNEAFKIGFQDFCEVYHPGMVGLLSDLPEAPLDFLAFESPPSKLTNQYSEEGRRVRTRTK